jgi:hypothetical protein
MKKRNHISVSDHYIYTPSTTDVTIRWRAIYNWTPPSEDPRFMKKWADFRMRCVQGIEQIVNN